MLKELNDANRPLTILAADSPALSRYGRVLVGMDCGDMFGESLDSMTADGPTYIRDIGKLREKESFKIINENVYGGKVALQAGTCFGMNDSMNGMEYHEGSEVIVAVTDVVLILGRSEDIADLSWDSSLAECFYIPRGTVLELYSNTLHLAPCRVTDEPFCVVIILPEGTNRPLEDGRGNSDPTYFMENKWLICHSDSPAARRGGHVGIRGENIQIKTI